MRQASFSLVKIWKMAAPMFFAQGNLGRGLGHVSDGKESDGVNWATAAGSKRAVITVVAHAA